MFFVQASPCCCCNWSLKCVERTDHWASDQPTVHRNISTAIKKTRFQETKLHSISPARVKSSMFFRFFSLFLFLSALTKIYLKQANVSHSKSQLESFIWNNLCKFIVWTHFIYSHGLEKHFKQAQYVQINWSGAFELNKKPPMTFVLHHHLLLMEKSHTFYMWW